MSTKRSRIIESKAAQPSPSAEKDEKPLIEPPSEGQKSRATSLPERPAKLLEEAPHQRSVIFTMQLELCSDGSVRRTLAKYAGTEGSDEKPEQWSGWDVARLESFIEQRARIRGLPASARKEDLADRPLETDQEANPHAATPGRWVQQGMAEFSGESSLRKLDILPVGDERPHHMLSQGHPFQVRLALDLADVVIPDAQPLNYAATIFAKRVGSGTREKLGETHGQLAQKDTLTLDIPANNLSEGLYRLEALVDLGLASDTAGPQHTLMAQLKGSLLRIY